MLFEDMNWMDVERYLERDDRVVVVTGACEQHGYLSLLADIRIPLAVAREACGREGILIAPPLLFGISPYFTAYPGTLSLRPETFATVVRDAMWEWTWRTAPPAERRLGALDPTWVFVTSRTGAVEGLLVSWEVRFDLPEVTTIVARPVVRLREGSDVRVPDGCGLLLHVDEKGRASRVQALRCDEWDRRAVEVELMSWTFEPLVVDGEPRAFAVSVYSSSGGASPNSPSGWARK